MKLTKACKCHYCGNSMSIGEDFQWAVSSKYNLSGKVGLERTKKYVPAHLDRLCGPTPEMFEEAELLNEIITNSINGTIMKINLK